MDLKGVSTRLGADEETVKLHAHRMGIFHLRGGIKSGKRSTAGCHGFQKRNAEPRFLEYREGWQTLIAAYPDAGRQELRMHEPRIYTWLRRHDPEWLDEQVPLEGSDCHKRIRRPRIDWTARDESLSKAVTAHACRLKDELSREAPLTKTAIARAVGNPSILKNLAKLPQTAAALREVQEGTRVGKSEPLQVADDGIS